RDQATRDEVRGLREQLVLIGQEFGKNIIEDVRTIEIDPAELDGLPTDYVASHQPGEGGKVRITTDNTDYVPFITYARSSRAREALWRAYRERAQKTNLPVLDRLLRRRHELATLLGYPSYAALATEDKMIGTADKAAAFIEEIAAASGDRSARDYAQLLLRKQKDDPSAKQVDPWDASYLSDRVSHEQAGYSAQEVRPYLEYRRVSTGVLATMSRLFGVRFVPSEEDVGASGRWHESVELFDVVDDTSDRPIGRIYLDMHPRDGKYKHYAQFTVRTGVHRPGRERLPEGALLCNFPDPSRGTALLELDQVRTFFHEFGHLMHHLLGGHTPWAGVSGVATEWDFVEAPSQLLEEWAWDPATLATFARHHDTNEPLPAALLDKARKADALGKGLWVRQQMLYAAVSLEYHRRDPATFDTSKLLAELQARYTPYRYIEGTAFQASFGHLSGYSAVYYTYMWSLVIAKDLFSKFTAAGLDDVAPARRYRDEVLVPGGSRPAAELCERFLGRPYEVGAYRAWLDQAAV
ncbi:MAG: M3 family metallopeptidase, partial [Polyangia bacterium]